MDIDNLIVSVLDSGYVSFVDVMGDDLTVVNAARVSYGKRSEYTIKDNRISLSEKDENLISFLARNNHWTPFAHPQVSMRIKAPISIRTQFFKHKQGFVENEISGRYVEVRNPEVYCPTWRSKAVLSKQGSQDFMDFINHDLEADVQDIKKILDDAYNHSVMSACSAYNRLISYGVAPEQARFVLPQGTYTEWVWTGSLAGYARFFNLRNAPSSQWEIREYAKAIGSIIEPLFPVSWKYLVKIRNES